MTRKPYWEVLAELNQRDYERSLQAEQQFPTPKPEKPVAKIKKCSKCRRRPAVGKFSRCQICRDNETARRRRAEARGDCQSCYCKPAVPGFKKCYDCRLSAVKSRKTWEQKQKELKNERR